MGGNHPRDVLSPRSGYYAGYLIVKKIVKKLGFPKFIKLSPNEWEETVFKCYNAKRVVLLVKAFIVHNILILELIY